MPSAAGRAAGGGQAPPVDFSAVPAALREHAQWLLWRAEQRAGEKKPRKVPYYASGARRVGTQGDAKDRARLVSFERACAAFGAGRFSGIGFAFLPGDGLIGVDIDAAIDTDTGEIDPRAQRVIAACDSWTEISQSGRGVHIYLRGRTETHKTNAQPGRIGLEIFCESQFFVVTGRTWPGAPAQVREAGPRLLAKLHKTVAALRDGAADSPTSPEGALTQNTAASHEQDGHRRHARRGAERAARETAPGGGGDRCDELRAALAAVSAAGLAYDEWLSVGMTLKAELGDADGLLAWDRWSALDADRYPGTAALARKWQSFREPAGGDLVFKLARAAGWKPRRRSAPRPSQQPAGGPRPAARPPAGDDGPGQGAPLRFPFLTDKLKPRGIRENVYFALRFDAPLQGLVAFNEFTELHEKTREPPWRAPLGEWRAIDDLHLANYLAHRHRLTIGSPEVIQQAVDMAARDNPRHPLRDWLRSLSHDGTARLDHWLVDLLGAPDTPYTRAAGRMFLLGMVARVMRPGCKMDYALILQGPQGVGKSSVFRALAEPWFSDTPFKIGDKDALMSVQGVWLHEFSELDSLAKSEETAIKAFVSSTEDRFRPPYGTRMLNVPRRVTLCGTTNAEEFLRDATGGRRFWPIKVGQEIDLDAVRAVRDQLFAEAVARFDAGERWYPTREEEKAWFAPEQEHWKLVDVWTDYLSAYVNSAETRDVDEDGQILGAAESSEPNRARAFFSTQELISKALRIEAGRIDNARQMQRRVAQCMAELGFVAYRQPDGKRKRGYLRAPKADVPRAGGSAPPGPAQPPGGSTPPAPTQPPAGSAPASGAPRDRARAALQDEEVAF